MNQIKDLILRHEVYKKLKNIKFGSWVKPVGLVI